MREALFIFAVILVLAALTAFRYRKQIIGMIELARTLKKVGGALSGGNAGAPRMPVSNDKGASGDTALVNCSTCGVWTPQTRARMIKGRFYCSDECFMARVA